MLLVFPTSIRDAVHLAQLCGALDNHAEADVDAWFPAARDESGQEYRALGSCELGRDCNGVSIV